MYGVGNEEGFHKEGHGMKCKCKFCKSLEISQVIIIYSALDLGVVTLESTTLIVPIYEGTMN